jgi:hypothetical protein
VTFADTREEAEATRVAAPEVNILAVRPSWSFPAAQWVAADPPFWRGDAGGGGK